MPPIGIEAGGPVMRRGDVAHDQRPTAAFSLVYDIDPLDVHLHAQADSKRCVGAREDLERNFAS